MEFFASPTEVEQLTIWSRTPQEIIDALSPQTQLTSLTVKWGPYTDLAALESLHSLVELDLRGATRLESVAPLSTLPLQQVRLEDSRTLHDYSPLGPLRQLTHLSVGRGIASTTSRPTADSLEFIAELGNLERLVWDAHVTSLDFTPLLELPQVPFIGLTGTRGMNPTYATLRDRLPGIRAAEEWDRNQIVHLYVDGTLNGHYLHDFLPRLRFHLAQRRKRDSEPPRPD